MVKFIRKNYGPDDPIYQNQSWTIYTPKGLKSSATPDNKQSNKETEQALPAINGTQETEEEVKIQEHGETPDKKWKKFATTAQMKSDFELFKSYYPGLTWKEFEEYIENYIGE